MTTERQCFLCNTGCLSQWEGDNNYHIDWYNCVSHCGRFGISVVAQVRIDQSEPLQVQVEKQKLASFAYQRKTKNKKPFLLYAEDKELDVFREETKSNSDLFKWDELVSLLTED